jgi:hypothetical protein
VLAIGANPVVGGLTLSGAILTSLQRATELVTKLSSDELVVYEALAAVLVEKKRSGSKASATIKEVQYELDKLPGEAPDPDQVLQNLEKSSVVKGAYENGIMRYAIVA